MASISEVPRSLHKTGGQNRKARVIASRRELTGQLLRRYRTDPHMEGGRQINAIRALFSEAGVVDPVELLTQKVREKKSDGKGEPCVVLDIGCRTGLALQSLAVSSGLVGESSSVQFMGMDALMSGRSPLKNIRLITGNILSKPFPKSDIAFSLVVLSYAGNIGFLVRKTANALKPNGIAVLYVNKKGRAQFSDPKHDIVEGRMVTLIKDMPKLARQLEGMRLQHCSIQVFTPKGWGGNLAVVIRKK